MKKKTINFAVAIHSHSNGIDGYLFAYDSEMIPDEDRIVVSLGIDYEPNKGEDLLVSGLTGSFQVLKQFKPGPKKVPFVQ